MQQKLYKVCSIRCMKVTQALRIVGDYAADQWGMVTTAQAVAAGVDRTTLVRLVDAGLLESPARGVYVVPAASPTHVDERAAWLRLEPSRAAWKRQPLNADGGVLSHRSAAKIHGLGDLITDGVDITVPRRRTTRDPHVRLRRGTLTDDEVTVIDGLPVTTVKRTVLDLLADHVDGGHVGDVIADALRRNDVDLDTLAAQAGTHAAKYGIRGRDGGALLTSLLSQATEGDTYRRDAMVKLLSTLDHRQQRILLELAEMTSTDLPSPRQSETGRENR